MENEELNQLLYEALETELGGVKVYEQAIQCAMNEDLKTEWEEYLEQNTNHVKIVRDMFELMYVSEGIGLAANQVTAIKAIQHAWQHGGPLAFRGEHYRHTLMTPFFDPGPNPHDPPPVWLAGLGPRMTRAAGESADGLLVHPFHSERYFHETVLPAVYAGLAASGRDPSDFSLSATPILCTASTDEDLERAIAGVNVLLAFYGSTPSYRVTLDAHGWGDLQLELNRLTKEGRWDEIDRVLPDEVVETIAVCCRPDEVAARLQARYGDAVDRVGLSMPYTASDDTLAAIVAGFRS
jgi:probable F420-dependent oxidoreductase